MVSLLFSTNVINNNHTDETGAPKNNLLSTGTRRDTIEIIINVF